MARRLFFILAAAAFLLAIATIALHLRSYWRADFLERESIQTVPGGHDYFHHGIQIACGRIALYAVGGTFGMTPQRAAEKRALHDPRWNYASFPDPQDPTRPAGNTPSFWNQLGFSRESVTWFHAGNVDSSRTLTFPMALVDLATLTVPAVWIAAALARKRRRLHRIRQGLCPTCSYDLRAHHAGQKCPECGIPIAAPSSLPAGAPK